MKKILFVTHTISNGGGAEKVLNTLIDELKEEYQIDVLEWLEDTACPFWERPSNVRHLGSIAYTDRKAASLGKSIYINKLKHNFWAVINTFFPKFMHSLFIKDKYDYEISFNYLYTSALVNHSPNKKCKKINWMHGAIDDLNEKRTGLHIKYRLYKWMQHKAFNQSNRIIAISTRTRNSIEKFQPGIKDCIQTIYNGYDLKRIEELSIEESVSKSNCFRIISLGRLDSNKNNLLQIQAIEELHSRNIEVELLILGQGELENELKKYAQNNIKVRFLGYKSNPYPYLAASDALIITSLSEGFPTIAVEAMALGKPVISTPVAGTDELITEDTGLVVDWDKNSVADGIKTLISKKYYSDKIKRHVSPYTKESWATNVKRMLNDLDNEQ